MDIACVWQSRQDVDFPHCWLQALLFQYISEENKFKDIGRRETI